MPSPLDNSRQKKSPRANNVGFVGHKPLSSRKNSDSKPSVRPYSAKYSSNQKKKPFQKQQSNPQKGLAIKGEEIKPIVVKHDGRKKVSEVFEEEKNKLFKEKERLEQKRKEYNQDRVNQINQKVNNIYKIPKTEEEKVLNEVNYKPHNFVEKPLANKLEWMKPSNDNMENSKENNPFAEENKRDQKEAHAREKINKYRRSILNMLESEVDEVENTDGLDGLETNREISDEEDRDDDNIMDGTRGSIKIQSSPEEEEKDLNLDSDSEPEPVPIEGKAYFLTVDMPMVEPLHTVLKNILIDRFGVEKTERGIEYVKKKKDTIYLESRINEHVEKFKNECFDDSKDAILEFISTASSLLSYT